MTTSYVRPGRSPPDEHTATARLGFGRADTGLEITKVLFFFHARHASRAETQLALRVGIEQHDREVLAHWVQLAVIRTRR